MSLGIVDWDHGRAGPLRGPRRRLSFTVDLPLLITLLLVTAVGFVVLYSALGANIQLMVGQAIRFCIAFAAFFVLAQLPPHYLRIGTPWFYVVVLGLLLLVMVEGEIGKGAQRWLKVGFFRFQPSELMKLAVPMMVAWYMHDRHLPPRIGQLLVMAVIVLVPALIIERQPDLGTALLVAASGGLTILLAGISWRILGVLGLFAVCAAPLHWMFAMSDYQKARVLSFLNPESDPLGAGYNSIQAKIAIGSGGLFGKGWFNGTQAHLEFLPERSTDFIFAVMAEEFGLLGLMLLLVLYLILVGRGLYIAAQAQDTYTRLLAGALSLTFFIYVFVNAGMVSGLLPVVGVPLPLVSAGGTSMVTLMAGFGMLAAIGGHRKLLAP
jgi:rod shape determining protein RodA